MSPETSNLNKGTSKLFTVPAKEFLTKYQPLTAEELAELGEAPIANAEDLEAQHDTFLKDTFDYWSEGSGAKAKISAETLLPADQNWSTLEKDIDPTKFGEYTLNPDTQHLNFETTKVFIPDLSAFNGKKLSEVAEHLIATYSDKYDIPGLEYWEWLVKRKNLDDLPTGPEFETLKQELKDRAIVSDMISNSYHTIVLLLLNNEPPPWKEIADIINKQQEDFNNYTKKE